MRGFFGIGVENIKNSLNYGTLFRSANVFGAEFMFTTGRRFLHQCSDTMKSYKSIPTYSYESFDVMFKNMPFDCQLIGVELDSTAVPLLEFTHPERAIYLLGAEDSGLSKDARKKCAKLVQIPGSRCLNVSVAGSIVMYDRIAKTRHD